MSLRARFILSLGLGGILFLFIITVSVFSHMESAMVEQLEQRFQSDVHSRIVGLNTIFSEQTEHFQFAARLPMFRSMRFHQLTLNQSALKNDVRQLELYFLDLINQNSELTQVRYINKQGAEIFRVNRSSIKRNLSDLSQDKRVNEMLKLKFGSFKISKQRINGKIQNIIWWIPVYASSEVKYGVMSFSFNYQSILDRVGQMVTSEAEEVCLSDVDGTVLFSSNKQKTCAMQEEGVWHVTEKINLPGLSWKISLSVDKDVFLVDVKEIKKVVFAVIFPVVAIIAFILALIFSNNIIRAISQLVDAARIMGRGEQLAPIKLNRGDELDELAKEMNRSARMIENNRNELVDAKKRDLQAIMDHSPAVIYIKDANGHYTFINKEFEKLFHINRKEIIGKTDYDIFSREFADVFQHHDKIVLASGRALEREEVTAQDDGPHTYISIKFPLLDSDDNIYAVCGISTDITERKQTEEALRRSQKMDAIGQLSGGIAHDFNNQLGVIVGYLDFLKNYAANDEQPRQWVDTATSATLRCMDLTRQLLAFSRSQSKEKVVADLGVILKDLENMIARSLTPEVEVQYCLSNELWLSEIDPGEFQDAILNLVINARDAMPSGGKLLIEVSNKHLDTDYAMRNPGVEVGDYVQLMLSDTGIGMDKQIQERIFEPFYTTKPEGKGTGLGLAMVYGFAKRYGGNIKVYSEPGVGTSIRMYLPRSSASELADTVSVDETKLPGGSETILIVDDEVDLLQLADLYLSDLGYHTCTAENTEQALAILEDDKPVDLLFSDVVMPGGINGYELAQQATEFRPALKVLLTSGFTSKSIANNGLARFSAHLLSKPYRKSDLAQRIRCVLDETGNAAAHLSDAHSNDVLAGRTILVVDDEEDVQELYKLNLERLGCKVLAACNGEEAITLYRQSRESGELIDIIILDLSLASGMDGKQVANKIREMDPKAKMIVASGYVEGSEMTHYQDYGFQAALEKNFNREKLKQVLGEVLASA